MSYGDAAQNRTVTIGAVVVVHAALGYALLTGLATDVIRATIEGPLTTYNVKSPPPPPPEPLPIPEREKAMPRTSAKLTAPEREVVTPSNDFLVTRSLDFPKPLSELLPTPLPVPAAEPAVSLARGVAPRGNQGDWFPQDSYPAAARRAGAEGRVSVRVTVGADGRVSDCAVIASSGHADLDSATCRLARRNGRFEAARDAAGSPTSSSFTLRNVSWLLE